MQKVLLLGLAVVFGVFILVGRSIADPDPSVLAYHNWLVRSGTILGALTGLCSGGLAAAAARSPGRAVLGAAAIGACLMVFELALYGLLLPDFLMLPPGQVPQDNFEPWLLAGFPGLPLSILVSLVSGWLFWFIARK